MPVSGNDFDSLASQSAGALQCGHCNLSSSRYITCLYKALPLRDIDFPGTLSLVWFYPLNSLAWIQYKTQIRLEIKALQGPVLANLGNKGQL